jgi:peptidoglycan/LPS O-acetylase OafA/YrhL
MYGAVHAAPSRLAYIDGLRGIAVLSVVLCHVAQIYGLPFLPGYFMQEGAHGVDLFFVISGFCLSYPALHKVQMSGAAVFDTGRFVAARIVRIIPPYWAAIIVSVAATSFVGGHVQPALALRDVMFLDPTIFHVNGAFWTLPIEMRWYAVFPLLLLLWVRAPRAFTLVGVCALISVFTQAHSTDLDILPAFMLGVIAADRTIRGDARSPYIVALAIVLVAVASQYRVESSIGWSYGFRDPLWYAAAFFLVLGSARNGIVRKVLSHRLLTFVGYVSYSIYLVHVPAIWVMHAWGWSPAAASIIAIVAPVAFWALFERPFVSGSARHMLLGSISRHTSQWLKRLGIAASFDLTTR